MRAWLAAVVLLAGCATTGPSTDEERPSYRTPILLASVAGGIVALYIAWLMTEDVDAEPAAARPAPLHP